MGDGGSRVGAIGWVDLTVEDAAGIRDFYREVVGCGKIRLTWGDTRTGA